MKLFIFILVMFLVTYIPRMVPITFISRKIQNRFFRSFLYYTPYAVLSVLTFPAIFYSVDNLYVAIIATSAALILSFCKVKVYYVIIISTILVYILSLIL